MVSATPKAGGILGLFPNKIVMNGNVVQNNQSAGNNRACAVTAVGRLAVFSQKNASYAEKRIEVFMRKDA